MKPSYWTIEIKSGAYVHRKGMCVTPLTKDMVVTEEYVRGIVEHQQGVQHSAGPAMPRGEIVSIRPREPRSGLTTTQRQFSVYIPPKFNGF